MKLTDALQRCGIAALLVLAQVVRLMLQVVEVWMGRQLPDWHKRTPFQCARRPHVQAES
jgi:hypothetical protein